MVCVTIRAVSGDVLFGSQEVSEASSVMYLKYLLQSHPLCENRAMQLLLSSRMLKNDEELGTLMVSGVLELTVVLQLQGVRGRINDHLIPFLTDLQTCENVCSGMLGLPQQDMPSHLLRQLSTGQIVDPNYAMVGSGQTHVSKSRLMLFALQANSEEFIRALVHDGADLNKAVVSVEGRIPQHSIFRGIHSALYFAITAQNPPMVRLLLELGADVHRAALDMSASEIIGLQTLWAPLDLARDPNNFNPEVVALLEAARVAGGVNQVLKLLDFD